MLSSKKRGRLRFWLVSLREWCEWCALRPKMREEGRPLGLVPTQTGFAGADYGLCPVSATCSLRNTRETWLRTVFWLR
jgi:hypothetical protein